MNRLWLLIDRVLPPSLVSAGPEQRQAARLTVLFAGALTVNGPIYIALFWAMGAPKLAMYVAIGCVGAVGSILTLRLTSSVSLAANQVLIALWSVLVPSGAATGGYQSPAMIWFTLMPAFGMLLVGRRTALAWTGVAVATGLGFVARGFFVTDSSIFNPTYQLYYWLSSPVTIIPLHLALVALFNAARARMLQEVDSARQLAAEAHNQARVILDAANQGLVVVDRDARIQPGSSAAAGRWFGQPAEQEKLWAWVDRIDANAGIWLQLGWDQLVEGVMPSDVVLDQLARELSHAGREYELTMRLVDDGGPSPWTKALVVINDVTEAKAAARADSANRELITVLSHLSRDRMGFFRFLEEQKRLVATVTGPLPPTEALRAVHTLKGNSSLYGLSELVLHCHELESRLQSDERALSVEEGSALQTVFQATLLRLQSVVGRADMLTVSTAELDGLASAIAHEEPHALLAQVVRRWTWTSLGVRLEQFAEQASALAARMGKGPVSVAVNHGELFEAPGAFGGFWSTFSHMVRNAVDHGLEQPEVRAQLGKPAAKLTLSASREGTDLVVRIADDGAGINWDCIRAKAKAMGIPHESRAELEKALWTDGISTAQNVTDISGRGVGMSATLAAITQLGGSVSVESQWERGTTFTFRLPGAEGVEQLPSFINEQRKSA